MPLKKIPYAPMTKKITPKQYDKLVDAVNALRNITHDKSMRIVNTERGVHFSSKGGVGGEATIQRWAYSQNAAGGGTTAIAYLDTDLTGRVITVNCIIHPSTGYNLGTSVPRLEVGSRMPVALDNNTGDWYCLWGFVGTGVCS